MRNINDILAKSEGTSLVQHLKEVAQLAVVLAKYMGLDEYIAYTGAILHDIGKVSPLFQQTLESNYIRKQGFVFRHEIASLFFLSLVSEKEKSSVIDMIVAHHKSIYKDVGDKGILDLVENDPDCLKKHLDGFEEWQDEAFRILEELGVETKPISRQQAEDSFWEVVDYCESMQYGYSKWKGVLIAADHLASALNGKTPDLVNRLFILPDVSYYNSRQNDLYA
ncbi:MAG: CRISPR-associated endonuclease Cas3'', partial [Dysgonamonadaceae bacterium]|nr:CRISPR-associated endonuclease Cas3'' [Dysgonamonadaceae bacterium]